jgi:hypothetical protein
VICYVSDDGDLGQALRVLVLLLALAVNLWVGWRLRSRVERSREFTITSIVAFVLLTGVIWFVVGSLPGPSRP